MQDYRNYGFTITDRCTLAVPPYNFQPYRYSSTAKIYNDNINKESKDKLITCGIDTFARNKINYKFQCGLINSISESLLPDSTLDDNIQYHYSIHSFLEESMIAYMIALDICKSNGIKYVLDIGCSTGIQSYLFNSNDINYMGIDNDDTNRFFPYRLDISDENAKNLLHYYYVDKYPDIFQRTYDDPNRFNIPNCFFNNNSALISIACIFYLVNRPFDEVILPLTYFSNVIIEVSNDSAQLIENSIKICTYFTINTVYKDKNFKILYLKSKR